MASGTRGGVDAQRVVWTVVVAAFLVLAVAAPAEMLKFRSQVGKAAGDSSDGQARVSMVALAFSPEVLAVRRGTEVVFENNDLAPHTVTDARGTAFDSGTLNSRKA